MAGKLIIGICGPSGAGKSELRKQLPPHEWIYFARAIKQGLEAMGVPGHYLYDPEFKNVPVPELGGYTSRHAMRTLGTEWGRDHIDPNLWVNFWEKAVEASTSEIIVVDDLRFAEEVAAIQKFDHKFVEVLRPGYSYGGHRSEQFDAKRWGIPSIVNDGTPEELYQKFMKLG